MKIDFILFFYLSFQSVNYFFYLQGDDGLMHFFWKDRKTGAVELVTILTVIATHATLNLHLLIFFTCRTSTYPGSHRHS